MMPAKINNYFKRTKNTPKYYNGLVESVQTTFFFKKLFGTAVFEYKAKLGKIESKFTFFGLVCFLFWHSLFFYCVYSAYCKDQSILRLLYDTKLKQYGDDYERVATIIFVLYAMWKMPFNLNANTGYVQYICDIDRIIASMGVAIDYNKNSKTALFTMLCQVLVLFARSLCIWVTIGPLDMVVPYERMFQVCFCDVIALMLTGLYCYSVSVLRERYATVNKILDEIKTQQCWEYTMFVRGKPTKIHKTIDLQQQNICKKIKTCAKIHSMLYKATKGLTEIFGVAVMLTMFFGFNTIVLYLFYFMEATASCLFHDLRRYVYFFIYVLWQAAYATGIIYFVVYFSERTVQVAVYTSYITHEIVNSEISPSITKEAMQLSMQLLHQVPMFTACAVNLDYEFLHQGGRSIVTYLVILLQFVMEE